jgi:hypothetical protein
MSARERIAVAFFARRVYSIAREHPSALSLSRCSAPPWEAADGQC